MGLSLFLPVGLPLLFIPHRGRSWVWKLEYGSEGLIPGTFHLELDGSRAGPANHKPGWECKIHSSKAYSGSLFLSGHGKGL